MHIIFMFKPIDSIFTSFVTLWTPNGNFIRPMSYQFCNDVIIVLPINWSHKPSIVSAITIVVYMLRIGRTCKSLAHHLIFQQSCVTSIHVNLVYFISDVTTKNGQKFIKFLLSNWGELLWFSIFWSDIKR